MLGMSSVSLDIAQCGYKDVYKIIVNYGGYGNSQTVIW